MCFPLEEVGPGEQESAVKGLETVVKGEVDAQVAWGVAATSALVTSFVGGVEDRCVVPICRQEDA